MVIAESKAAMGTVVNQAEIIFLKSKMLKTVFHSEENIPK
jgi:hypothetical protein